jgi:hypothetical protein
VVTITTSTTTVSYRATWRQTDPPDPPDPALIGATPSPRPPSLSGGQARILPRGGPNRGVGVAVQKPALIFSFRSEMSEL